MSSEVKYYPLTHPQKAIWYTEKFHPDTSIGNITGTLRIKGSIDYSLLEKAINIFLQKNDSMRIRIVEQDGEPKQYISKHNYTKFDFCDFGGKDIAELYKWDEEITLIPMKLIDSDLFHFTIIKVNENDGGFYAKFHHLISDAWTFSLLGNQIVEYYSKLKRGIEIEEQPNPSYIEYISSEVEYKNSERFLKHKEYWNKKYETLPEFIALKSQKTNIKNTGARRKTFVLSNRLTSKIHEYCKQNNISIFMFFLAGLSIYVNRVTSKEDIGLGTLVLNRSNAREKKTTGMFISTMPVRINVNDQLDFKIFAQMVSKEWMAQLRYQKYPYDILLKDIREKHSGVEGLYDIVLSYQNAKFIKNEELGQYETRWHFNGNQTNSLTIHINDREDEGHLILDYDFLSDQFYVKEIEFLHDHMIRLLWHAIDNPVKKICKLDMLSEKEKHKILHEFNDTYADYPKDKTIHQLFEEQVERTPDNIALVFEDKEMTYRELNEKANQLARVLRDKGVKPDDIAGLMVHRSFEMIIGILGVLKAGGAYLPIDPEYPEERIKYMLENSNAGILLTQKDLQETVEFAGSIICLDDETLYTGNVLNIINVNKPEDLIYVIYTSGSTGKPKGVMVTHRGLVNYIWWANKVYVRGETVSFPLYSSLSFDLTVTSVFTPVISGNRLIVYRTDEKETLIRKVIKDNVVDIVKLTPAHLQIIKDLMSDKSKVKRFIVGGEDLKTNICREIHERRNGNIEIYNEYGPTETVVGCMIYKFDFERDTGTSVPIGIPGNNVQIYILDKNLNPVPIGIQGEVCISGDGAARGYLNRADLTAEKFINNPFIKGTKIYKTGDVARWFPKGNIEYLGRMDYQLKIRGFRVELGEIESCLLSHPDIKETVVIDREEKKGKKYLCAYFISNIDVPASDLRAYLSKNLPNYMIPSVFIRIDKIPLSPNGKVDRKVLPEPKDIVHVGSPKVEPGDSIERILVDVWKEVFGVEEIGIEDNLFELGGDSLSIIQIQTKAFPFGWGLSTQDFYRHPTIKELADRIRKQYKDTDDSISKEDELSTIYDLSNICNKINVMIRKKKLNHVLLTGATGFLGAHLLDELISSTKAKVYCLIRSKSKDDAERRLLEILELYFPNKYGKIFNHRIHVVNGDIILSRFGLSEDEYLDLSKKIDTIIHSAALVKHYGNFLDFEKVNVLGTKEIIKFALDNNKLLGYISTVSVSGNYLTRQSVTELKFTENDFYIGQNFEDNVYIRSKFEAEKAVLEAISAGLNAVIFRIGNLVGRYKDGFSQTNFIENAFLNRFRSILEIGVVPIDVLQQEIEFTPVDYCSKAIVGLIKTNVRYNRVYHLFNHNKIKMIDLFNIIKCLGIGIQCMEKSDFRNHVLDLSRDSNRQKALVGLINDFNIRQELDYKTSIIVDSKITQKTLNKIKFHWPQIDSYYIITLFKQLIDKGFITCDLQKDEVKSN